MAFDKKAYNRAYYEAHKEYWQNRNGVGSRRRNTIRSAVQDRINAMGGNAEVDYNSRARRTLLTPGYKQNPPQTVRTIPGYTGKRKISTADWDSVNKKRDAAYADASYKQGRRAMRTGASVATTNRVLNDIQKRRADEIAAQVRRHKYEGKNIATPKPNNKSGIIPRALRSYGSYYKIGVKSIGNSLSNAPKKVKNKLSNFYKKWLKW